MEQALDVKKTITNKQLYDYLKFQTRWMEACR